MQKIIFAMGAVVVLSTTYRWRNKEEHKGGMCR